MAKRQQPDVEVFDWRIAAEPFIKEMPYAVISLAYENKLGFKNPVFQKFVGSQTREQAFEDLAIWTEWAEHEERAYREGSFITAVVATRNMRVVKSAVQGEIKDDSESEDFILALHTGNDESATALLVTPKKRKKIDKTNDGLAPVIGRRRRKVLVAAAEVAKSAVPKKRIKVRA